MNYKKTAGSVNSTVPAHHKRLFLPIASLLLVCLTACTVSDPAANTTQPEPPETSAAERTVTEVETGTVDGLDYELWKDTGTTEMTLNGGGTYRCQWSDINNALFRIGKKFDSTQNWDEVGEISVEYGADYFPVGNSYLCVYGWTREPLVEYYVVQSWGNWRPPGAESLGTITVDDATYDVYVTTRVEQPSIDGTQTFQQFWSVRKGKSTEGTISVSEHFRAWQEFGMELGKLYEVALTVEGYQSSGTADVYKNEIRITPTGNEP